MFTDLKQRIHGFYLSHMLGCQLVGALLLIGSAIAVITFIGLRATTEEPPATDPSALATPPPQDNTLLTRDPVRELVEKTFEAHGGRARIEALQTLARHGTVTVANDSISAPTAYLWKAPNLVSFRIDMAKYQLRSRFDGETVTETISRPGFVDRRIDLSPAQQADKRHNADIVVPFKPFLNEWSRLRLLEDAEIDGQRAHVIEWAAPDKPAHRFFIDPTSFLVIRRERDRDPQFAATAQPLAANFKAYEVFDGLLLPTLEEVFVGGELINTFAIDTVEINPGIFDDFFLLDSPPPTEAPAP